MAQAPYDEVKARIEALKGQGRPVAELDAAVTAGGWTPDAFKAQAKAAVPFDKVKATVEALKAQGRPVADLDAAVTASGMTPDEYKAQAKAAPVGSGGPFGGGAIEAGARGFLDAATFGGADELGGMIEGLQSLLEGGEYGKAYHEAVARRRQGDEAFATAYPKTTVGGEVAGGLATAPLLPGGAAKTALGAVARGAGAGAAGGAAYGFGSGEGDVLDRAPGAITGAATGAVLGGGLGGIAHGLGFGTPSAAPAIRRIVTQGGNLTAEAADAIKSRGIEPNLISPAVAREAGSALAGRRADADSVAATLRTVLARKHGVELAGPQATQDVAGVAKLQAAQAGTMGEPAQRAAETAGMAQQEAFGRAAGNLAQNAAPGALGGYGESGTGALLAEGVNQRAKDAWQGVRQLYGRTGTDQHMVTAAETKGLLPTIQAKLDAEKLSGITEGVPGFTNAMQTLKRSVVDNNVSFADADEIRKVLGQLSRNAADKTDRYKIDTTIKGFDDWLDGVAGSRASTLPADSLAALRQARAGAKDWFRTFQRDPRNPGDAAGKLVEAVRTGSLDNQALFDKLMGSRGAFDEAALPAARKVRGIVGEQSPEWQTLRQGMIRRVLFGDANKQAIDLQPGEQAWKTMDTRISQALDGRGAELAGEMLGADATRQLRELREVARALAVKGKAANPSGTGYEMQRAGRRIVDDLLKGGLAAGLGTAGFTAVGPVGAALGGGLGLAGGAIGRAVLDRRNARAVADLLRPHRAPKAGFGFPGLPALSPASAAPAEGDAFDKWLREHR